MHQCKTVAHILLILSIFNLVFAVPVVRETFDEHDDVVAPVIVRDVAAMSKERRAESDGTTLLTASESPLPQDETMHSHDSPPPPPDESTAHPGGSAAVAAPSPPDGSASLPDVPPSDQRPAPSTPTPQRYTQVTHAMVEPDRPYIPFVVNKEKLKLIGSLGVFAAVDATALWLIYHYTSNKLRNQRRSIDHDR